MRRTWVGALLLLASTAGAARIVKVTHLGTTIVEHDGVRYRIKKGATTAIPFWSTADGRVRLADPVPLTQTRRGPIIEGETRLLVTAKAVEVLPSSTHDKTFNEQASNLPSDRLVHTFKPEQMKTPTGRWPNTERIPPQVGKDERAFSAHVVQRVLEQAEQGKLQIDLTQLETVMRKVNPIWLWDQLGSRQMNLRDLPRVIDDRALEATLEILSAKVDDVIHAAEQKLKHADGVLEHKSIPVAGRDDPSKSMAGKSASPFQFQSSGPWELFHTAGAGDHLGNFLRYASDTADSNSNRQLRLLLQQKALGEPLPTDPVGELVALELKRHRSHGRVVVFVRLRTPEGELSTPLGEFVD